MKRKIELLAPGGDIDSIKAAIVAGANAVYCGLDRFNARARAQNISFDNLKGIIGLAHRYDCQVFLTLNVIIVESEIPAFIKLLNRLSNTNIDGLIVQDVGIFYLLSTHFTGLTIHASTQCTTHNEGQIKFLSTLGATRVNLSRELSLDEIRSLTAVAHENSLLTEVFVYGSHCISFSGVCYLSSVLGGRSGNRGRCSQPCREQYVTTSIGKKYPLNLKDNSAYSDLKALSSAGVDSIKIEGRMKKFHYVYTVVNAWKKQLERLYRHDPQESDTSELYKMFNRDFSNSFLQGDINKTMFTDNPRDNSARHLAEINGCGTFEEIEQAKRDLYDHTTEIRADVRKKIDQLSIAKAPLDIVFSGKSGSSLQVSVQTSETSFVVFSDSALVDTVSSHEDDQSATSASKAKRPFLNEDIFRKRFKAIDKTEYFIRHLSVDDRLADLFIPFQELTLITKRILFTLNGSKELVPPVVLRDTTRSNALQLQERGHDKKSPTLSLLLSSSKDLPLCHETSADIYFQVPSRLGNRFSEYVEIFRDNNISPWFPSILIGDEYRVAVEFLEKVQPQKIVTNNTGIAYVAYEKGIPWIAGPSLNIVNSYSLVGLKEKFNCYGSFISNEISRAQIKGIRRPDGFRLLYSIYHPLVLLTSRQCLLQPVIGCHKDGIDENCLQQCQRSASIENLHKRSLFIDKAKGEYHSLYNEANFLNTEIVTDMDDLFTSFFIDLRDIKTKTTMEKDKSNIIGLFENLLKGKLDSVEQLKHNIRPTTNGQYSKGI